MHEQQQYQNQSQQQEGKGLSGNARIGFIKKVYSIITCQLVFTAFMCFLSMKVTAFRSFQLNNQSLFTLSMFLSIGSMLVISFCKELAKKVPINYILLFAYTLGQAYLVSAVCCFYRTDIVIQASFLTAAIALGLTLYAMTTKKDYSYVHGGMSMFFSVFTCVLFMKIFFNFPLLNLAYSLLGSVALGFYMLHDTQQIIGGKKLEHDIDNYIYGAMTIYSDIIQIFLKILKFLDQLQKQNEKKQKK